MDNVISANRAVQGVKPDVGWIGLKVGCPAVDVTCRHLEAIDQTPETAGAGWLADYTGDGRFRGKEWT
jgi:hypothetical protein